LFNISNYLDPYSRSYLQKFSHSLSFSEKGQQNSINSSESIITPQIKLAMSLRYLVGGNPLDICFGYGLSNKTFYSPKSGIWNVLEAIYEVTKDDIQLGEPIKIQIKSHGETEHDLEALLSTMQIWNGFLTAAVIFSAFYIPLHSPLPSIKTSSNTISSRWCSTTSLTPSCCAPSLTLVPFRNYQRLSVVLHSIYLSLSYQSPRNLLLFLLTFSFDLVSL
jgi:hypothetical protein